MVKEINNYVVKAVSILMIIVLCYGIVVTSVSHYNISPLLFSDALFVIIFVSSIFDFLTN